MNWPIYWLFSVICVMSYFLVLAEQIGLIVGHTYAIVAISMVLVQLLIYSLSRVVTAHVGGFIGDLSIVPRLSIYICLQHVLFLKVLWNN